MILSATLHVCLDKNVVEARRRKRRRVAARALILPVSKTTYGTFVPVRRPSDTPPINY